MIKSFWFKVWIRHVEAWFLGLVKILKFERCMWFHSQYHMPTGCPIYMRAGVSREYTCLICQTELSKYTPYTRDEHHNTSSN